MDSNPTLKILLICLFVYAVPAVAKAQVNLDEINPFKSKNAAEKRTVVQIPDIQIPGIPPQIIDALKKQAAEAKKEASEKKNAQQQNRVGGPQAAPKLDADAKKTADQKAMDSLNKKLKEIESVLSGDDESANSQIIKKMIAETQKSYIDNHRMIVATRTSTDEALEQEEFDKVIRRQKILVQHLIELDARKSISPQTASEIIRKLQALQNNPLARKDQNLRTRISQLRQKAYEWQNRSHRANVKKTIQDITKPLVGKNHLGLTAADDRHNYPYAHDGLIQQWRPNVKSIVRLMWFDSRLKVDRSHWDSPFAGKTEEDIENEVATLLSVRGFKQNSFTDPREIRFRPNHYNQMSRPNLARLFASMQTPNYRSSSWGGNQQQIQMQFGDQQRTVKLKSTATTFSFDFTENDERGAMLRVREQDGRLTIESLGDVSMRFRQFPDGSVEVVEIADDDMLRFEAESFVDFYRKNVEYCELRFLPLLDYLGVTPPISRLHPDVMQRVINELYKVSEYRIAEADELIAALSSPEYSRRELAGEKLKENVARFAPALKAALHDGLPVESRMRIKSLLHDANRNESDELVMALKLLDDIEYLKVVQNRIGEQDRQVVTERIQKLAIDEQ